MYQGLNDLERQRRLARQAWKHAREEMSYMPMQEAPPEDPFSIPLMEMAETVLAGGPQRMMPTLEEARYRINALREGDPVSQRGPGMGAMTATGEDYLTGSLDAVTPMPLGVLRTVYHGTPHKWMPEPEFPSGRPLMEKIGTGEGAQAYGHGIYFAESPAVASSYREALSSQSTPTTYVGDRALTKKLDGNKIEALVHGAMNASRGDTDKAIASMRRVADKRPDTPEYRDALAFLEENRNAVRWEKPGVQYTLDLPDEVIPNMLDWDLPFSSQPESVQRAIENLLEAKGYPNKGKSWLERNPTGESIVASVQSRMTTPDKAHVRAANQFIEAGIDPAQGLKQAYPDITPEEIYAALPPSYAFRQAGIPGLRYFDQSSRQAGEGTRNYVIWDQDLLNRMPILEQK
jgi:hypothetical protein